MAIKAGWSTLNTKYIMNTFEKEMMIFGRRSRTSWWLSTIQCRLTIFGAIWSQFPSVCNGSILGYMLLTVSRGNFQRPVCKIRLCHSLSLFFRWRKATKRRTRHGLGNVEFRDDVGEYFGHKTMRITCIRWKFYDWNFLQLIFMEFCHHNLNFMSRVTK